MPENALKENMLTGSSCLEAYFPSFSINSVNLTKFKHTVTDHSRDFTSWKKVSHFGRACGWMDDWNERKRVAHTQVLDAANY